jgi:hypothetical protein
MRQLLSTAVSAVLVSTAACVTQPIIIHQARTEAHARPADTKAATAPVDTADAKAATGPADAKAAASGASAEVVLPAGWSLVTSPVGGFRVAFPSSPEVDDQLIETEVGYTRMISYGADPRIGRDSYLLVNMVQYPDGAMRGKPADQLMKAASDGMLARYKFTLVSEKAVRVDGARGSGVTFPGLDFEATEGSTGMRLSVRIILVHDRMYQLMVARRGEETELFQQLLSTFSLQ